MQIPNVFGPISQRLAAIDAAIHRREHILPFLMVRLILMSGMVVGFRWWALHLSP